jgi:GT2 family glycosyltransferase
VTICDIGIIVPTLGFRINYLRNALLSIRAAGNAQITIVAPNDANVTDFLTKDLYDIFLPDPGLGLAAAIDFGIRHFSDEVKFINWLGDDDLLEVDSLKCVVEPMLRNDEVVMVYGKCDYIDFKGNKILTNRSGNYARFLMRFGPQLVSQPGSLVRKNAYLAVGGLNHSYKCAFDLDLFIKLQKFGGFKNAD